MAQTWVLNEIGDYVNDGGSPEQSNSLRTPAFIRMKTPQGAWMYAPDAAYGSKLNRLRVRQSNVDVAAVENAALEALQPMLDDGRASSVVIDFDASARSGIGVKTKIVQANGSSEDFNFQGLG